MLRMIMGDLDDDLREIDEVAAHVSRTDPAAAEELRAAGRRAVTLEREGDEYAAGEQYLRMVEPSRGSVPIYRYTALKLIEMERCGDALELADEVAQLNSRDPEAYRALGEICEETGAYAIAAMSYREALELGEGNHADLRLRLARMLHNLGRHEGAIDAFREALSQVPGDFADHINLGHSLFKLGLYGEAVEAYCRATELDPDNAEAHASLGLAHAEVGSYTEAVAALHRYRELGGHYDDKLHRVLRQAFSAFGMYEDMASPQEERLRRWDCSHCREWLARIREEADRQ